MNIIEFEKVFSKYQGEKPSLFLLSRPDSPATDSQLASLEERLSCKLPTKYIDFLRQHGGGSLGLAVVYSADPASEWWLEARAAASRPLLGDDLLPFSENFAGDYYVFKVTNGHASDAVWLWDHESATVRATRFQDALEFIAKTAFEPA